jgi:hypothetical protein
METTTKKKEGYRPKKSLSQYSNDELIVTLNNCELIDSTKLAPVCAEILKRMNQQKPLFQEKNCINHHGPIC